MIFDKIKMQELIKVINTENTSVINNYDILLIIFYFLYLA